VVAEEVAGAVLVALPAPFLFVRRMDGDRVGIEYTKSDFAFSISGSGPTHLSWRRSRSPPHHEKKPGVSGLVRERQHTRVPVRRRFF